MRSWWTSRSKAARWACIAVGVVVVVTALLLIPAVVSDPNGSAWTAETESAFLEGCRMTAPQDPDLSRFCACILVDMKKANKSPDDAADVSDRALHNGSTPGWAQPIISRCQ